MHLDHGQTDCGERIADSERSVRVGGGIDDDAVAGAEALLDLIDDLAFEIALKKLDLVAALIGDRLHLLMDILHLHNPVNSGLAHTEHIDIRSLNHHNFHFCVLVLKFKQKL